MASGSFQSSTYKDAGSNYHRYIDVIWSSTNGIEENESIITWDAYSRSPKSDRNYVMAKNIIIKFDDEETEVVGSTAKALYHNTYLGGGTITVKHDDKGKKSVSVSIEAQIYKYGTTNSSYYGDIIMSPNPVYDLNISEGTGVSVAVNRTYCAGLGETGNLSAGTKNLYYDDILKITFTPSLNHTVTTNKVNDSVFTSDNSYTVTNDVSIIATATPLKSTVSAMDANIGSATTIIITRYNSSYTHSLTYSFGNLTGVIEAETTETSVGWTVPTDFYSQITNIPSDICTITCTTYDNDVSLGSSTCTFTATAAEPINKPSIIGTVTDTNSITTALTGDSSVLIKNKSTVLCALTATPNNFATISSVRIGGTEVTGTTFDGTVTATKTYTGVSATSFDFYAIDTRGYDNSVIISPTIVNYTSLTCNPNIYRNTPTGNTISMSISGNFYKGSFGAYSNTLTLQYRYKETGGSFGDWIDIDSAYITIGTHSYRSTNALSLQSYPTLDDEGNEVCAGFDYHLDYEFQVRAMDGANSYVLSTVTKTVYVTRGVPIYDWGENDFNFNVPLMLNGVNIFDIIFPVGAVYTHSTDAIPLAISNIGTWKSIVTGISDVYAWKRTL